MRGKLKSDFFFDFCSFLRVLRTFETFAHSRLNEKHASILSCVLSHFLSNPNANFVTFYTSAQLGNSENYEIANRASHSFFLVAL